MKLYWVEIKKNKPTFLETSEWHYPPNFPRGCDLDGIRKWVQMSKENWEHMKKYQEQGEMYHRICSTEVIIEETNEPVRF